LGNIWVGSNINATNVYATGNISTGNLYASNIIMSSNMSSGTGYGNVYLTGNLVVNGNIFSSGGSVGSGSGTSQGILFTYAASNTLPAAFSTGTAGPGISGYHINMASFTPEAAQAVTQFTYNTGMLKFSTAGLYQLTCVIVGDQPAVKVAVGKTSSSSFPPSVTATSGYDYVYNYPVGASPSQIVTIPMTVTDITQYYYLDVFFSTAVAAPTVLYPTRSTTAAGTAYGTYVQVAPFGNYLTSATGVASALLCNCSASSNLSGVYSSNAYRLTLTTVNGWTVNGTSTSLAVTANGNFQVNQTGIYEVNLCLNTSGNTPVQFQVGSLSSDSLVPNSTTPSYVYTYAPMYTQDPTTVVSMPLNITNVSNVYFVECSFPGTVTGNVALSATSTFVSIKPIGGYINTGTNPWIQQGTSVYYNGGAVGIGGVVPTSLTETLTVNGNTSFVGNVSVVSDASSNNYVLAKRVPAGSFDVTQYVTGRVPLTTTTNLIQNYLSNAASITSNTGTGTITQALYVPGASSSNTGINFGTGQSLKLSNLATSNLFIEMSVNFAGLGRFQNLLMRQNYSGSGTDIGFYVNSSNQLVFYVSNATATVTCSTSGTVSSGWRHLAASYVRTNNTQGTLYAFIDGTASTGVSFGALTGSQANVTATANIYMFHDIGSTSYFSGNVADVRVMTGSIVPVASFTAQSAPFTTAPTYRTGMDTGYTSNLTLALQSQYFPGASTSPYGPCLTLPGTVGSYYQQGTTALNTALNSGFTIEAWVNFASLANSNTMPFSASLPAMLLKGLPTAANSDWFFGPLTTGQLCLDYYNGVGSYGLVTAGTITTGSWNHLVVQGNTAGFVNMFINGQIQTLTGQNYTPTGSGTSSASINGTVSTSQYSGITVGQYNSGTGPNFAIAKARILFGANTYTTTTFTPSPNLGPIPAGATVAWQLDSQYPLPTYPSIQDVTPLPQQTSSYGAVPTVVGGVTSNTIGPYTAYPAFDSIRFDGTGYIDYGNAASSALTTNLWANAWTIEGWVYPTSFSAVQPIVFRPQLGSSSYDLGFYINQTSGTVQFASGSSLGVTGSALPLNTWTHVAVTWDGARSNIYQGISGTSSTVVSRTAPWARIGFSGSSLTDAIGNLTNPTSSGTVTYTTSGGPFSKPSIVASIGAYFYYTIPNSISVDNGVSFSLWVKINQTIVAGAQRLISFPVNGTSDRFYASISSGALTLVFVPSENLTLITGQTLSVGSWYNVVGTINASTKTLSAYVNGSLVGTPLTYTTTGAVLNNLMTIGARGSGGVSTFGQETEIADVRVYNQVLPASEISIIATQTDFGAVNQTYNAIFPLQLGTWQSGSPSYLSGNLADVRVSNVARYTGSSYTVPTAPFSTDSSTLLLLKSLGGQVGTTLEVQGRGLGSVSLGGTRTVQSYPPAPMSSYLLDTTGNTFVTYGQGKYVASASSEYISYSLWAYYLFDYNSSTVWASVSPGGTYNITSPYAYNGSVVTVDTLGNAYAGEWAQLQMPVSVILSSYSLTPDSGQSAKFPSKFWILGSRDGTNWTLVDSRNGVSWSASVQTFTVGATQGYNYYRIIVNQVSGGGGIVDFAGLLFNGTEESLCVTNDSKVGVGIANPQRALEVAGDLVVGGTISGGAGLGGFRNRIINGDMRIAQRGTSATTAGYLIDRWNVELISGTITQSQILLSSSDVPYQLGFKYAANVVVTSSSTGAPLNQRIENVNLVDLNWGTSYGSPVTVSLWYKTNATPGSIIPISIRTVLWIGAPSFQVYPYNSVAIGQNTWQYVSFTVPPIPNIGYVLGMVNNGGQDQLQLYIGSANGYGTTAVAGTWTNTSAMGSTAQTNIWNTPGNYISITGVQLEKGSVATPFEFRPYATELALCQRYYQRLQPTNSSVQRYIATGCITGTTSAMATISLPVGLRSNLVTLYNNTGGSATLGNGLTIGSNELYFYNGSTNFTPTSVNLSTASTSSAEPSTNLLLLNFTGGSGGTAGGASMLLLSGAGAFLAFGAEL
jgi:hypothetical protein